MPHVLVPVRRWGTKNFRQLGLRKCELILSLLRAGADPIVTDADALITRDPTPFIRRLLPEAQVRAWEGGDRPSLGGLCLRHRCVRVSAGRGTHVGREGGKGAQENIGSLCTLCAPHSPSFPASR